MFHSFCKYEKEGTHIISPKQKDVIVVNTKEIMTYLSISQNTYLFSFKLFYMNTIIFQILNSCQVSVFVFINHLLYSCINNVNSTPRLHLVSHFLRGFQLPFYYKPLQPPLQWGIAPTIHILHVHYRFLLPKAYSYF